MSHPDANRWNERYSSECDFWSELHPSQLLRDHTHLLPARGIALDAACGMGRNGIFLAERGLRVIFLDISGTALSHLIKYLRGEDLEPSVAIYDLSNLRLPDNYFDVIMNFRFLKRITFPIYRRALKPGGILFFETFLKSDSDSSHPEHYLDPGELLREFKRFEVIHWQEKKITKRGEKTQKWIAQLVARKPGEIGF